MLPFIACCAVFKVRPGSRGLPRVIPENDTGAGFSDSSSSNSWRPPEELSQALPCSPHAGALFCPRAPTPRLSPARIDLGFPGFVPSPGSP
jgi:hypothetical protein